MSSAELSRWFSEQVQPHEPALRAYLLKRFPTLSDHDDVIQDSYSRLLQAHAAGRLTHAKAFLFTTARNAAIDLVRRRGTKPTETLADDQAWPALEEPLGVRESLERQQQLDAVVEAVLELPERCREVVLLKYFDGLSSGQIAAQLGITADTVRVQMFKGVQHCIAFFAERGLLDSPSPEATP
jgi:RNA polymerase sigma-70 factor (ECF subfamily)